MSTLWLPDSYKREDRTFRCRLCSAMLRPAESAMHVKRCYARQEAEIRESSLREKAPALFGDNGVDVEFLDFHRRRRDAA